MKKTGILILALLILLLSTTDLSAAKSRTAPTVYATLVPFIYPIVVINEKFHVQGAGQIYNGLHLKDSRQYLKAGGFFLNAVVGTELGSSDLPYYLPQLGLGLVVGGYIFSILDANLSPKRFNQQRLKSRSSKVNSAPPRILIGFRF